MEKHQALIKNKLYTYIFGSIQKFYAVLFFSFVLLQHLPAQQIIDTTKIYGVTIDDISNLNDIRNSLSMHCRKMTTRIVFDQIPAVDYIDAVDSISDASFVMGEILDSYYMANYTIPAYISRTHEYLNQFLNDVDIWEIGNEVNGEWLGNTDSVAVKISDAFNIVHSAGKKTALTLYYNDNCWSNPQNEMFTWVNANITSNIKQGLDYLLVSYYEDDCNNLQPDWQSIFDSLHVIFPNSKLGMGECGTAVATNKAAMMHHYYEMNISTPGYIGGYFWWYYKQDCVPQSDVLWDTLNTIICSSVTHVDEESGEKESIIVSPNPSDGKFNLTCPSLQLSKKYILEIYNMLGEKIYQNSTADAISAIDISSRKKGIYFIKILDGRNIYTKKIALE